MTETEVPAERAFPAPVRIDGYFRWTWRLFRGSLARLAIVFVGGVALVRTLHFLLVVAVSETTSGRSGDVATLATSLASGVILAVLVGSLLAGIAATVFVERLCGRDVTSIAAWRRLRPRLGHAVVAGLYVSMPLVLLLFVLGPAVEILVGVMILPALLGPPVLVQAIAWERKDFREAATRAKNLLAGHWGRVVSALLLIVLGAALAQILFARLIGGLLPWGTPDRPVEYAVSLVILVVTSAAIWLFAAAAGTVAYLDLRARFEELDYDALVAELEPAPAGA